MFTYSLKIFSNTLTESITLTQKWGKTRKIGGLKAKPEVANARLYDLPDRSDYSGTTELYRTVSLTVPGSTTIFCDFLIFFLQDKKIRVGTKIIGRVGLPEPHNFFVLAKAFFKFFNRHSELIVKYNIGLKAILQQGISEHNILYFIVI